MTGTCGENLTWTLDDDGTLIFDGTGSVSVRYEMSLRIKKVIVNDGVTTTNRYAFSECMNLAEITIPDSVEEIGESAFECCSSLKEIKILDNVWRIESGTFFLLLKLGVRHSSEKFVYD